LAKKISLEILLDLANKDVDLSVKALAGAVYSLKEAEERLKTLERFYDDYLESYATSAKSGLTAEELKNQQIFMARLNTAIAQQRNVVSSCALQAENRRSDWQGSSMKLKSYGILSKRAETTLAEQASKREQRLLDEFTTRKFLTNKDQ
jgi:flagellar protein FliJ